MVVQHSRDGEHRLSQEEAKVALLDALSGEDEQEAAAAVKLAVAADGTPTAAALEDWLDGLLEPVTAFKLSRGDDGEITVALMRRPSAMCHPRVVVGVDVPVDDPTTCVDAISLAGEGAINAFIQDDHEKRLQYVVFEGGAAGE